MEAFAWDLISHKYLPFNRNLFIMKKLFPFCLIALLSIPTVLQAQKYFTRNGHAYFMSHTDAIDIDGNNHKVMAILDTQTSELVFGVLIKAFTFTLATAEEHFNESYMESNQFPKAKFSGKIIKPNDLDYSTDGKHTVTVAGQLTIRGVTKEIEQEGELEIADGTIHAKSAFQLSIDDYDIEVPKVVEERVAKIVDVTIDVSLEPYKK